MPIFNLFFFLFFFLQIFHKRYGPTKKYVFFLSAKRVNQSMYHYHIEQTKRRKRLWWGKPRGKAAKKWWLFDVLKRLNGFCENSIVSDMCGMKAKLFFCSVRPPFEILKWKTAYDDEVKRMKCITLKVKMFDLVIASTIEIYLPKKIKTIFLHFQALNHFLCA